MIKGELGTSMEAKMNVEQEVLKEQQGHELKAEDEEPSRVVGVDDERRSTVSNCEAHEAEEEEDKLPMNAEISGSAMESPEAQDERAGTGDPAAELSVFSPTVPPVDAGEDHVEVVVSDIAERPELAVTLPTAPATTPLVIDVEEGPSAARDSPPVDAGDLPSSSSAPTRDDLSPGAVSSPGKKGRSKKGRLWKKNGGKTKPYKDSEEQLQIEEEAASLSRSVVDAEPEVGVVEESQGGSPREEPGLGRDVPDLAQSRAEEGTELTGGSTCEGSSILEDMRESAATRVVGLGIEEDRPLPVEEEKMQQEAAAEPSSLNLKTVQSVGRWADKSEHNDSRAAANNREELERLQMEEARANTSWTNNYKEQELRGKSQQGREAASPASREANWRRRPAEFREFRLDSPKSTSKSGIDGDAKKDEQQDFRSRAQHGAEPQATHKNWIPRRGLQRSEVEGRLDQSKARGKGKQGREGGSPNLNSKDFARQKFEADLKVKQDELLQKSKMSLRAEFQKVKRIEQARKGRDELEMELNKNLVYEDGELFYLNMNP